MAPAEAAGLPATSGGLGCNPPRAVFECLGMTTPIRFGISTCPNDTFAYHAILERRIDLRGLDFRIELLDVQELNERLAAGDFDVAKASFHAALEMTDRIGVLPVGSALGFGVGPLLLAAAPDRIPSGSADRVFCPGAKTTATLLYRLFWPGAGRVEQTVFDRILPALSRGEADFGVCIHEGRFTYREHGLHLVEDLGERFEREAAAPLPLGGIFARHELGDSLHARVAAVLRDSLDHALANREETRSTMRRYAQELDDAVIDAHVDLYVNEWTRDLGEVGERALARLFELATEARIVAKAASPL